MSEKLRRLFSKHRIPVPLKHTEVETGHPETNRAIQFYSMKMNRLYIAETTTALQTHGTTQKSHWIALFILWTGKTTGGVSEAVTHAM